MSRKPFVRMAALLLLLLLVAAACGSGGDGGGNATKDTKPTSGTTAGSGKPVTGGTLRFGLESDVATLDPTKSLAQPADKDIGLAVYDGLMTFDDESKVVPGLAESLTPNADLTEYTMKLRTGIQFQDGTPFNADAVVAHFNHVRDPATASTQVPNLEPVKELQKVDETTLVWKMKSPQVAFPQVLAGTVGYIPSPTAVAKYGKDYDQHPVGTGPFMLTEFIAGDHVTVVKNPNYWRKDDDGTKLPYLDKIIFRPIPDSKQRIATLKAGDVDMIQSADASTIKDAESAGLKVQKISGSSSTIIMFNNTKEPVNDRNVRVALDYATDKATINKVAWGGTREVARSTFNTGSPYYDSKYKEPQYDPAKAKAMLKAYGKPVNITLECIPTPEADQILQIVKQTWEAAGAKVTLRTTEQGQYVNRIFQTQDYQVACFRSNQFVDPDQLYTSLYSTSSLNVVKYKNPKSDAALNAGRTTGDFAERKTAYSDLQAELAKDIPAISLAYDLFTNIYKPGVHGLPVPEGNSLGAIRTATLWMSK